ncbi:MAG TPA: 3',5'-cyclic-nucleotide phosphodiesterase [Gammaproteobacteria bacterium]|nr:3',5'-cyclic-nucleotide phosphodiesterase [Gammaproteobacteria bacterium]
MQLRILGCSGGIGQQLRTSSYLIDDDILLDAGTGVGDLGMDALRKIRRIFITHSHMDHIVSIPLLIDTVFSGVTQPLEIYARAETLDALRKHIFNWTIWPDFSELPSKQSPVMVFRPMKPGDVLDFEGRRVEMIDVSHTVPACGYAVTSGGRTMAYSGDTSTNETLWSRLNQYSRVDFMIVETAFANHDLQLSQLAKHYCPSLLATDLKKFRHRPLLGISHLKPGEEQRIMDECRAALGSEWSLHQLATGETFQI